METSESPVQRFSADQRRRNRVIIALSALLAALVVAFGIGLATGNVKVSTTQTVAAPAAAKVAKQDCKKPGTKVGALCSTVTVENGVTVTRTYVTLKYDVPANKFYNYLQGTSVQLNYTDTPTIDLLCRAGAVALTTPDHDYAYQYDNFKREVCNYAQKAKDNGDADECLDLLNEQSPLAPLAFTYANMDDACAVPVQPKAKEALVDTSKLNLDIPWYDASAAPVPTK